jgi:hypothetical protein
VEVQKVAAAFDTARRYQITATDASGTYSSPTPREVYVEYLISQSRNAVTDIRYGAVGGPYVAVAPGGALNLVVGNTYDIQLVGGTATQGNEQFEAFINFPNTIFQILAVDTDYAANTAPARVSTTNHPYLYADACGWENDPNSPNYRACNADGKAGGAPVVTTYTVRIVSGRWHERGTHLAAVRLLRVEFSLQRRLRRRRPDRRHHRSERADDRQALQPRSDVDQRRLRSHLHDLQSERRTRHRRGFLRYVPGRPGGDDGRGDTGSRDQRLC